MDMCHIQRSCKTTTFSLFSLVTADIVEWLGLLLHFWEIPYSNLGLEASYLADIVVAFFTPHPRHQGKCQDTLLR
jgi:hypothetical protein